MMETKNNRCRSEQDEMRLVTHGKIKELTDYAKIFGLHDRALRMLFTQNHPRKARAYVSEVKQRLPEDIVTEMIEKRRYDEVTVYLRYSPLGLVSEYMLAQTRNRGLIGCYQKRWGFRSIMARHYLEENGLAPQL